MLVSGGVEEGVTNRINNIQKLELLKNLNLIKAY